MLKNTQPEKVEVWLEAQPCNDVLTPLPGWVANTVCVSEASFSLDFEIV